MHILIAPNAFKNSINADQAAITIKEGFLTSKLDCTCELFPIGDGGDGTGNLIIEKLDGVLIESEVNDPLGKRIKTFFGLIDQGMTAVIEMANASGMRLLHASELSPLTASSYGLGELMKLALDKGVNKLIICMGGSATVDGGCGVLKALGIRFFNKEREEISGLPESLDALEFIDVANLDQRILKCQIIVLCDVDNFLLGENGSAAVFGPQKGASQKEVAQLEQALIRLTNVALKQTKKDMSKVKYGGTAGGAAAGLYAFLNASLVNGIEYFFQLTGFNEALQRCELVVTGEGSIDEQTLHGKGPFGVARKAKALGLPVIGLAGKIPLQKSNAMQKYFDVLMPIGNEPTDNETAINCALDNLKRTSYEIGNLLAFKCNNK